MPLNTGHEEINNNLTVFIAATVEHLAVEDQPQKRAKRRAIILETRRSSDPREHSVFHQCADT